MFIPDIKYHVTKATIPLHEKIRHLEAEIESLRKQIPAGYKVVPEYPDDSLIEIMTIAYEDSKAHDLVGPMEDAYKAMIEASPLIEGK